MDENVDLKAAAPNEIRDAVETLSAPQLQALIIATNENHDPHWKQKIQAVVKGLNRRDLLEEAGKALTAPQFLEVVDLLSSLKGDDHLKLLPLLIGMPLMTFVEVICTASKTQMDVLKLESVTEPIQHQLTLFCHEIAKQLHEKDTELEAMRQDFEQMDVNDIGHKELRTIFSKLEMADAIFQQVITITNKALAIAWNTNRPDLVEKMSTIKESCHKYRVFVVGHPRDEEHAPTGLFLKVEEKLAAVYGNPQDPYDIEALADDEPSIEALVKFAVWYLHDYWEIGLFPHLASSEDLELDPQSHSEQERIAHRDRLFALARENLEKLGLSTLGDLKKAQIFSKKALQEYISENQAKTAPS